MKKPRNPEAAIELDRLRRMVELYRLKEILSGPAIIAIWLLMGDEMWAKNVEKR